MEDRNSRPPGKDRRIKRFAEIAGIVLVLGIAYRPVVHYLSLPRAVFSSWVEPLATTGTRYRQRELFTGGEDARKLYEDLDPVFKANEQKRRLFATLNSGRGKMGLLRQYSTVEGRPIREWLLVQNGMLTEVKDSSRDGGAPPWAIYRRVPLACRMGFMRDGKFTEGEPSTNDSPVIVFQLQYRNVPQDQQFDAHYFF